jgi:hypothetical protein
MRDGARPTLFAGLELALRAVGAAGAGVPAGDDPLHLDLPSLGPGSGEAPDRSTVHVFASLYLACELEQAGVVPIAELLSQERDNLNVTSYAAAAKLDDFAGRAHQWYDRAGRVQLYARLFGIGPGATNDAGALVNREFVQLLGSFARALTASAGASAGRASLDAMLQESAQALLGNLEPRALGNTLLAARRIEDQVRHAVDVLRDGAIGSLVGARTMQETIVNILGKDAPDVQRLIDAGLAGQRLLGWLADAIPRLYGTAAQAPLLSASDPIAVTAALWLRALGLDTSLRAAA